MAGKVAGRRLLVHGKRCGGARGGMRARCGGGGGGGGGDTVVTEANLNPNMIKLQYAVRGPLVIRSGEIQKELDEGASKPFKTVIRANIGDAQAMGQKPITFIRQVLSCFVYPPIIESGGFPEDVKTRAKELLGGCGGGSSGSYTMSHGIDLIRKDVAKYIEKRDGQRCSYDDICLTTGASTGIKHCLQMFCNQVNGKDSGVMIPIPQYPLYSASLTEYGLAQVPYYLDEENNWGLDPAELERAIGEGKKSCMPRAIVIINPGNPTGQVLTKKNIEDIIKFSHKHKLFIFADEVYQHNVYAQGAAFFSFKKILFEMGEPYNKMELASFMTVSKGFLGECGYRGGWMEIINLDPVVKTHLLKCISAMLCPNTIGQAVIDCIARSKEPLWAKLDMRVWVSAQARPPEPGEPSHELYCRERDAVLEQLKMRAEMIAAAFNSMAGFKCNAVQGAMYAFPQFQLSQKAKDAAKQAGKPPDVFYAFTLLEETGICIVPGSGFGQKPGTFHFRTTILPQPELLKQMLDTFKAFHEKFTKKYS